MELVDPRLVPIALSDIDYFDFERFCKAFASAMFGSSFSPSGGVKDGGLDGYHIAGEGEFFQFSKAVDVEAKIRKTIARIIESRGELNSLDYISSNIVKDKDKLSRDLSSELGVFIRIFDGEWIKLNINATKRTIQCFEIHLAPHVTYLQEFGSSYRLLESSTRTSSNLFVFLQQEVERLQGKEKMSHALVDSLIKWALEGTDPDKSEFMTPSGIRSKITDNIPGTEEFLNRFLEPRLHSLSQKSNPGGRGIRRYVQDGKYCLPFDLRTKILEEAIEDASIRVTFKSEVIEAVSSIAPEFELAPNEEEVFSLIERVIHSVSSDSSVNLLEHLKEPNPDHFGIDFGGKIEPECIKVFGKTDITYAYVDLIRKVLARVIYYPSEAQRVFLTKIGLAYLYQVFLRIDPNATSYFDAMSKKLKLFVGADVLVRCMTEVFLDEGARGTTNLLVALSESGAELRLSEQVLDEVWGNLKSASNNYENEYKAAYSHFSWGLAKEAKKILVRSFLYAVLEAREKSQARLYWENFVDQFCDHQDLRNFEGRNQIQDYFLRKFSMRYISKKDIEEKRDPAIFADLQGRYRQIKEDDTLADNDASLVSYIYGLRQKRYDTSTNKYGYTRWWLTEESRVISQSKSIIQKYGEFALRPDFLFMYMGFKGEHQQNAKKFENLAMSAMGVKLSNRIATDLVEETLSKAKKLRSLDSDRAETLIASLGRKIQQAHRGYYDKTRES